MKFQNTKKPNTIKVNLPTTKTLIQNKKINNQKPKCYQIYLQKYDLIKFPTKLRQNHHKIINKSVNISASTNLAKNIIPSAYDQFNKQLKKNKLLKDLCGNIKNTLKTQINQKDNSCNYSLIKHDLSKSINIDTIKNQQNHQKSRDISRAKSTRQKINLANKSKTLNYPLSSNTEKKWYEPIAFFFDNIFKNQNGCNCQQPCLFSIFLKKWSRVNKFYDQNLYSNLKRKVIDPQIVSQISKDIHRTQPNIQLFQNSKFQQMFTSILIAYSKYDKQVSYVQGMNFILSSLLYHIKQQECCFFVFLKLMDKLSIRKLFLKNFSQVYIHINIIKQYLKNYIYDLFRHLIQIDIHIDAICFPWVLSLMTVIINLEVIHLVIQGFIKQGWKFIYRVILTYFLYLKDSILQQQDSSQILVI